MSLEVREDTVVLYQAICTVHKSVYPQSESVL